MPTTDSTSRRSYAEIDLEVRDPGQLGYADAFELQKQLQQQVIEGRDSEGASKGYLLLVEHDPPVITISRRKGARENLIATDEQITQAGIEVCETNRGGDITYHGPGQLVAYPILDLNVLKLRIHSYMRFLEQIVIDSIAQFGIKGDRDDCATGVWVGDGGEGEQGGSQKICAMGVRVSRWVSMHGLALNVTTDLNHFDLIVPCGLTDRKVTSMQQQLGDACPTMEEVKQALTTNFRKAIVAMDK